MVNQQIQTTINVQEKSNLIWGIADLIRDYYKPHEYGKVILPFCVLKRFNDCLIPTKKKVLETYENVKKLAVYDKFLTKESGYNFYNTSNYDFEKLLDDPSHIEENFKDYLNGFSENVQEILENYDFGNEIRKLVDGDLLFLVIEEFNKPQAYMGADKVSSVDMGYIFEDLIKRFSESYDEQAGAHFTSRDIIYLMTDLLVAGEDTLIDEGVVKTVYDMTMGTSQMLTCMTDRLKQLDQNIDVMTFGQELNPETYAIAKSSALIHDQNADNMKKGNTLSDDKFSDYKFDYIISNPPFGIDYKREYDKVKAEHEKGDDGRFPMKLPKKSDGQMLFDLNGIKKLNDNGKMAIIHNGSALFSGAAESGESEIRRYMIENDWLDAIVQLSTDVFYNTGITTYIYLVSKNKPSHRKGKVQLIDASKMVVARRKNLGSKRNDISKEDRDMIVKAYGEFKNKTYTLDNKECESKIFYNDEFGYKRIQIETPKFDEDGNIVMKGKKTKKPDPDTSKRDYENIPLNEDIDEYFQREVKPYNEHAWVEKGKTKIGYEIPFTRYFYKYEFPEKADDIAKRITKLEEETIKDIRALFSKDE